MSRQIKPLFTGSEWDVPLIGRMWDVIDDIGRNTFGLDYYDPQIELISSEQMLDAYSSSAMMTMYSHWSFGKTFLQNERQYQKGMQGLAYEVVINTDPCIGYLMETNTATMQALVLSHALCGHNHFFKNNYLFKGWTDADSILDYLKFAKNYIKKCEEKHGSDRVEKLLDACHALQNHGIDKYKKPASLGKEISRNRQQEWDKYFESSFNDLWRTVPNQTKTESKSDGSESGRIAEENILYFIEKNSPILETWEREIVRIVRKISQYFYPQRQTQLLNEGFACTKGDTEYLSPTGWKRIDEYDGGLVAQYHEDGTFKFVYPERYIVEDHKELIHIHGERFDQCVTPDHRVPYLTSRGNFHVVEADKLPKFGKFITAGKLRSEQLNLSEIELRIMIAISADGHFNPNTTTNYVQFGFVKDRKVRRLERLLNLANIPYEKSFGTQGRTYINFNAPERNKELKKYYLGSESQLQAMAEEVSFWDGSRKNNREVYFSTNKDNADFVQYLYTVTGNGASLRKESKEHKSDIFFVEKLRGSTTCIQSTKTEKMSGRHRVYCFSVDSGMFLTRRNGKVSVTGNCFTHHMIMTELHEQGYLTDGSYLEFLQSHTNVVAQRDWDDKHYSGINVYALGFAMLTDIKRMCLNPDEEDLKWFPDVCNKNWLETITNIVANYRDESFILQFLSPKVARHFKLFSIHVKEHAGHLVVNGTHDDDDFVAVRAALAEQYDLSRAIPQIEVVKVDWTGDRWLYLEHITKNNQRLEYRDMKKTCQYINKLWGFPVKMEYRDMEGNYLEDV